MSCARWTRSGLKRNTLEHAEAAVVPVASVLQMSEGKSVGLEIDHVGQLIEMPGIRFEIATKSRLQIDRVAFEHADQKRVHGHQTAGHRVLAFHRLVQSVEEQILDALQSH